MEELCKKLHTRVSCTCDSLGDDIYEIYKNFKEIVAYMFFSFERFSQNEDHWDFLLELLSVFPEEVYNYFYDYCWLQL